jgi:hypothetical protein
LRAPLVHTLAVDSLEPKSGCAVAALGAAFPALTALHVLHSHKLSASTLAALALVAPQLRELQLDDTLVLPPPALAALPSFAALAALSLRYCALPASFDLSACAALRSLSLAGSLDAEDTDRPLRLGTALPPGLRRLDVSLSRVDAGALDTWACDAPGRTLVAFATVDGVAGGPYPKDAQTGAAAAAAGSRVFGDDQLLAATAHADQPLPADGDDDDDAPSAPRWLHAVVAHAVWAFLSLRDADDDGAPPPPPGPLEPSLRTSSTDLILAGVRLSHSPHADVRECAAGMLSSLANVSMHLSSLLTHGGLGALLRLGASAGSELVQELASEGLRNLTFQASVRSEEHAERQDAAAEAAAAAAAHGGGADADAAAAAAAAVAAAAEAHVADDAPLRAGRLALLSPAVLSALAITWRAGLPRSRAYAGLSFSDIGRMVIHLDFVSLPQQAAALAALLESGAISVYVHLMRSADVSEQYAGSRPLAVMSFLGRAATEAAPPMFGNHPQALANIAEMVRAGAVAPLLALLADGRDADIRAEAAGVVRNCCFANADAATAFAAEGGAAVLAALAASTDAEALANSAVESAVTALCNMSCACATTAAAVAATPAPGVLARNAADEDADVPSRWVSTVALCGLEAHGASPRAPGGGSDGGEPFAALRRLLRAVRPDGTWAPAERKGLIVQVVLQLAFCSADEVARVAACRVLTRLAVDPHAPRLVAQEGGRQVLRALRESASRAVRLEAERAAAALGLSLDHAPRASARLRARVSLGGAADA